MPDNIKTIMTMHTTVESKLQDLLQKDGQLIFVRDKHKLILDYDGKRTVYQQITELATDGARTSLLAPVTGIFYFVVETAVLWTYRGQWVQITTPPSTVPTKLSQLEQDTSHRVVTDEEKTAWNAKLDESALSDAINDALEQVKESGEFDGESGVHVGSSIPSGDQNVWIDPDGAPSGAEVWEFTLADGSIVTKTVVVL